MATVKLVIKLVVAAALLSILLFFVPWALNASNSCINGIGAMVFVGLVIAVIAAHYHYKERG